MGKKRGTWADFKLLPAQMMKLVIEGKVKIVGTTNKGNYIYEVI